MVMAEARIKLVMPTSGTACIFPFYLCFLLTITLFPVHSSHLHNKFILYFSLIVEQAERIKIRNCLVLLSVSHGICKDC